MRYMTNLLLDGVGEESRMTTLVEQEPLRIKALRSIYVSWKSLAVELPEGSW